MLRGRQTGHGSTSLADGRPGEFLAISCIRLYSVVFGCIIYLLWPCVTLPYLITLLPCYLVTLFAVETSRCGNKPFTEISIGSIEYNRVFCCWSAITMLITCYFARQSNRSWQKCLLHRAKRGHGDEWVACNMSQHVTVRWLRRPSHDGQASSDRWPGFLQRILCIKGSLQACHDAAMMPPRAIGVRWCETEKCEVAIARHPEADVVAIEGDTAGICQSF